MGAGEGARWVLSGTGPGGQGQGGAPPPPWGAGACRGRRPAAPRRWSSSPSCCCDGRPGRPGPPASVRPLCPAGRAWGGGGRKSCRKGCLVAILRLQILTASGPRGTRGERLKFSSEMSVPRGGGPRPHLRHILENYKKRRERWNLFLSLPSSPPPSVGTCPNCLPAVATSRKPPRVAQHQARPPIPGTRRARGPPTRVWVSSQA